MKKALYFETIADRSVRCHLCPHECLIREGKIGLCRGKENRNGTLYAKNYSLTTSLALDPIEKKPLYHFFPGRNILSIGPNGCNMKCAFCQNWEVSQKQLAARELTPDDAVEIALLNNSVGIAYTYSEPFIWYEYILDTAARARDRGLKNVLVTNGYVNEKPLKKILPLIDAMNIDVKSMDSGFYKKICKAGLDPVLRTVELASEQCHVEITNLVIPTLNDSDDLFQKIAYWIGALNPDIPLHFSRYRPCYKMTIPATPDSTLCRALELASEKVHYVYIGNSMMKKWNNTRCHHCKKTIITRTGFVVTKKDISGGRCDFCGESVPVIEG